jgi:glucose 1-dehydrogenase
MRAITVLPKTPASARLDDVPEPIADEATLLVQTLALGICGTDREIVSGQYGAPPEGEDRLILGHESLGRVLEAPNNSGFVPGDHVVGIVRSPDPVPCPACAGGEWDMCRNGLYTEHGIKARHGFGAERFRIAPDFAVKVDPDLGMLAVLLEPASILAKAWGHIEAVGRRSHTWRPDRVLVTGAGPIGFLAALMGKQRGLDVHIFDRATKGPKLSVAASLGAAYHNGAIADVVAAVQPDIVIEATGAVPVISGLLGRAAPGGIICLTGVSAARMTEIDLGQVNRAMVLNNHVVLGTVNANRRHYEAAAKALASADRAWLESLISRRVSLARWQEALDDQPDDIKVVIDFTI